jgi:hypothetical protein
MRKFSKTNKSELRRKADKLLQDYIRAKYIDQYCLNCGINPVQVGHHFISKKSSNALRYYLPNIIPLCNKCHSLVTFQPHLVEPKICFILGEEWYNDLMEVKLAGVKENVSWYEMNIKILTEMSQSLLHKMEEDK